MTIAQERQFLSEFLDQASHGGILIVSKIQQAFELKIGHNVAQSTIYRMLDRHDWRTIIPRPRLMLQDEGRFGRISTPQRCWAPRGIRPYVPSQIARESTYAYAAVSPQDGTMDSLILPQVSEQTMSIFLQEVSSRHPDEFILMVMDGAGWHKSKALSVPANMALLFLPPYSPELNSVEHIWEHIRENGFRNKAFNSIEAVEDQLELSLEALEKNPALVASMTGFPWIVSMNLHAK